MFNNFNCYICICLYVFNVNAVTQMILSYQIRQTNLCELYSFPSVTGCVTKHGWSVLLTRQDLLSTHPGVKCDTFTTVLDVNDKLKLL